MPTVHEQYHREVKARKLVTHLRKYQIGAEDADNVARTAAGVNVPSAETRRLVCELLKGGN